MLQTLSKGHAVMADTNCSIPSSSPRRASAEDSAGAQAARLIDRNRLITCALPAMESLHQQLASPTFIVLLADSRGTILSMVGPRPNWIAKSSRPPAPDNVVSATQEASLQCAPFRFSDGPLSMIDFETTPRGGLPRNRTAVGVATPIHVADGGVLGLIDIAATPDDSFGHANALLQTTAAIIEHRLVESDERGFLILRFHSRVGVLGSPLEAVTIFDPDSCLVATNRVALNLLSLGEFSTELRYPDCFDTRWSGLLGYAASSAAEPFMLRSCRGTRFFARASLR